MFTCNSYLNDVITYRASHYSLSQVLLGVQTFLVTELLVVMVLFALL